MNSAWLIAFALVGGPALDPDPSAAPIAPEVAPAPAGSQRLASTTVRGSLEASLSRAVGEPGPALAAQVARLLRWRGDVVRNVHPGDVLTILYTNEEVPELVAMRYRGAELHLEAFLAADRSGIARFYDGDGALIEPTLVQSPLPRYLQITETVQKGRGKRKHQGLDLKAPEGTPVITPFAAKVQRVNWSTRTNGRCVEVMYTEGPARGALARFLHLSEVEASLRPGQVLAAGAAVGAVGSTGRSSAPHLHYEIRGRQGEVIDPLRVHGGTPARVPPPRREAFEHQVASLRSQLRERTTVY